MADYNTTVGTKLLLSSQIPGLTTDDVRRRSALRDQGTRYVPVGSKNYRHHSYRTVTVEK